MNNRKIIFRADSGPYIGMGHFTRMLALAEMLNEDFVCVFATQHPTAYQTSEIKKVCDRWLDLPEDNTHFEVFLSFLNGDEIIVLDNYYFNTDYQKAIKEKGCKLVCIDDMHDKHYVADVVINHAPIPKELFKSSVYSKLLIGFDYALLRPEFLNTQNEKKKVTCLKKAFICIGGADIYDLSSKMLIDLAKLDQIETINIVVGNAYSFYNDIKEKAIKYSNKKEIGLYRNLNENEIIRQMQKSDFAIVPTSTILIEAISQNIPIITGYYVDNQKEFAKYLQGEYESILVVGNLNKINIEQVHIDILKKKFNINNYPQINKMVKTKYRKIFKLLESEFFVHCREASIEDVDIYFTWVNNKAVRENAIHSKEITYEEHLKWFKAKLDNDDSMLFIFEKNGTPIGQVRFDKSKSCFIIDYSIDEKFRGNGYGQLIIKMGLEKLINNKKNCENCNVKALVKKSNISSLRVFQNFGFVNHRELEIDNCLYVEFIKDLI